MTRRHDNRHHPILVRVDASDHAHRTPGWALLLAPQFEAEVVAVHAVGLLAHLGDGPQVPSHSHLDQLRRAFETKWCAPRQASPVAHRLRPQDGPPVPVLLATAAEEAADLTVVGSRGMGGFPELLLGSTSHHVAERASQPVLIVPPERGGAANFSSQPVSRPTAPRRR